MHRLLMPVAKIIDHINGDGLDNGKANLRPSTARENAANTRLYKNNKSGYRGVHRKGSGWIAQIRDHKNKVYLGCFKTKEAAALAWNAKALQVFGKFARLNNIMAARIDK